MTRGTPSLGRYNPLGKSKLREIFLKTENVLGGRYFAEITQELFDDLGMLRNAAECAGEYAAEDRMWTLSIPHRGLASPTAA